MEHLQFLSALSRRLRVIQKQIINKTVPSISKTSSKPLPALNLGNLHKFLGVAKAQVPPVHAFVLQRFYSGENKTHDKLKLMDYPYLFWPNIIKSIKNLIYTHLIIKPYLDQEFSLPQFVENTKHVAEIVSQKLSTGKIEDLQGLLTEDCLREVQKNLSMLSAKHRHEIAIEKGDIYFSFPYELGILFEDGKPNSESDQQRFVEVTVVHHVLRGRRELMEKGDRIPLNIGMQPEFKEKIFVINYRLIRNYSKGVEDQWTVNVVNHFKPAEHSDL